MRRVENFSPFKLLVAQSAVVLSGLVDVFPRLRPRATNFLLLLGVSSRTAQVGLILCGPTEAPAQQRTNLSRSCGVKGGRALCQAVSEAWAGQTPDARRTSVSLCAHREGGFSARGVLLAQPLIGWVLGNPKVPGFRAQRPDLVLPSPPWASVLTLLLNLKPCLLPKRDFIFSSCFIY